MKHIKQQGIILASVLVYTLVALIMIVGLTSWFITTFRASKDLLASEQAFQIAEAGVDYYRWFLANNPEDFTDGTGEVGPYSHDFEDKDGNKIGEFILTIVPPEVWNDAYALVDDPNFLGKANNRVEAIEYQEDGKIIVGGWFSQISNVSAAKVARLHEDGTFDNTFNVGTGANHVVHAVHVQEDGKILVGGALFTEFNGVATNGIVRLNSDGSVDTDFVDNLGGCPCGGAKQVYDIAVDESTGDIYLAGNIDIIGSLGVSGGGTMKVVRLNSDGTPDTGFSPPSSGGVAYAVEILSDGTILTGQSDGVKHWLTDGTLDSSYPNVDAMDFGGYTGIYDIESAGDGKLYIGGSFYGWDGTPIDDLVRINEDGSIDPTFDNDHIFGASSNGQRIIGLDVLENGTVVAGGVFSSIDGDPNLKTLVGFTPDGEIDQYFGPNIEPRSAAFYSAYVINHPPNSAESHIHVGGLFYDIYNGFPQQYMFGRLSGPEVQTSNLRILSTGILTDYPDTYRTLQVELDQPTFSNYAFISNSDLYIREGAEVFGSIHSNGGVRVDGVAHNRVTSAKSTYDDPSHTGDDEHSVHTHYGTTDPLPPTELPNRPDVFEAGRETSVPAVDFDVLTITIAELKDVAQEDGLYFAKSNTEGYHVVLKTDDTFDLYTVKKQVASSPSQGCQKQPGESDWNWSTWSIETENYVGNYNFPENNVMFFEDHVWVDGQIDGAHLTIVAGRFPDSPPQQKNIIINNDLMYTNDDGTDMIGLIAQKDILVGMVSDTDLEVNAAMLAKEGYVGRNYYPPADGGDGCSPYDTRNSLTINGMIASNGPYGFAFTDGTGYQTRTITYDANLSRVTPPYFPDINTDYQVVLWKEVN